MAQAEYARAEASLLTKPQIQSLGEAVASHIGFQPCGDIHEAVAKLGGKIEIQDTLLEDPERTGSLFVDGPSNFTIIVPYHTSSSRDRFTIAHELGHFIVHYQWRRQKGAPLSRMMALRKDSDRVEWEANWFAAGFLMPEERFKEEFEACGGDLDDLADNFCVSRQAAEIRAKSLGL